MILDSNYINTFFWKEKVGVDLQSFYKQSDEDKKACVSSLIAFYFNYLEETKKLKNVKYIFLKDIETALPDINELLQEKAIPQKSFKRKNDNKFFIYSNKEEDDKFYSLINTFKKAQ